MSDLLTLTAEKREQTGKGVARRLRAAGSVPGIFYNEQGETMPLQVNAKELRKVYNSVGRTTVFNVTINCAGKTFESPALFWDVDYHPTKNLFQHIDILGVNLEKPIKIKVPLVFVGVAKGAKLGGKLETYREIIEVSAKPLDLPKKVEVNITDMGINSTIHIKDLALPEGVTAQFDTNYAIISCTMGKGGAQEGADD